MSPYIRFQGGNTDFREITYRDPISGDELRAAIRIHGVDSIVECTKSGLARLTMKSGESYELCMDYVEATKVFLMAKKERDSHDRYVAGTVPASQ